MSVLSKRPYRVLCAVTVITALLSFFHPSAPANADSRPWTIPVLKQWSPTAGSFTFDQSSRVVVRDPALRATADTLAADLSHLGGRAVPVAADQPRRHDIELRLDADATSAPESYKLAVGGTTVISAATEAGVFWGTRSLLQLLNQRTTIPAGNAHDWPDYSYRGITLCNCVRYFSLPFLKRLIKDMSYLKYNVLHLEMRIESSVHPDNNSTTIPVYSKAEAAEIAAFGKRYHVDVSQQTPSPGHMDYFLAAHPELQVKDSSGKPNAQNIDMADPRALPYVQSIAAEQFGLFPGKRWYGGGDEYLPNADDFEKYPSLVDWAHEQAGPDAPAANSFVQWQNSVNRFMTENGRTLHLWNDQLFTGMPTKLDPSIVVQHWIQFGGRLTPAEIVANGNDIVNVSDGMYFVNDNPPNAAWIYETFTPNLFSGGQTIPADDPHLLGAAMGVWPGAHGQSEIEEDKDLFGPLRALAQKNWGGEALAASYADFQPIMNKVGHAPGYFQRGPVAPNQIYTLRNGGDGLYASSADVTARTGSVVAASGASTAAQRWLLTGDDYGLYALASAADGRCAAVRNDSYDDGATIATVTCDPAAANQKWLLEPTTGGYQLRSASSGRVLTSAGGAGSELVQRYGTAADSQRWLLSVGPSQATATLRTGDQVVPAGGQTTISAVTTNWGTTALTDADLTLELPEGFTATPTTATHVATLAPGASVTATWTMTVPDTVAAGFSQVHAVASYQDRRAAYQVGATSTVMATDASVRTATAFTADFTSHTVTPITLATGTPQTPIKVGTLPGSIIGDAESKTIYVANQGSASITVIDAATKTVRATVPVGTTPAGLALSPDGKTLWVSAYSDNAVQAVDVATLAVGPKIAVGAGPENLVVSPDGTTVWVACRSSNEVVPVDVASGVAGTPVPVSDGPNGLAITPDGKTLYVGQQWSNTVVPLDTTTRTVGTPITVGRTPFKLSMSPDGGTVVVSPEGDRSLYFIDTATNTVRQTIVVGSMPSEVVFSSTGTLVYAALAGNNTVVPIILPSGETGPPIPVGGYPIGIAIVR